jgi:hypothetical protein
MFITIVILDYLDKDTGWKNSRYPVGKVIQILRNSEELILTYDGTAKQVSIYNPTTQA